jgi:hypothetical protein
MAVAVNPYRGETAITLGGRTYVLRLTMNVLAALEDALRTTELPQKLIDAGFATVRATFHVALTTPDRNGLRLMPAETTVEQVGDLLDDVGGLSVKTSPVPTAYWELVVGAGFIDRDAAEQAGLVPRSERPGKGDGAADGPAATAPEAAGA